MVDSLLNSSDYIVRQTITLEQMICKYYWKVKRPQRIILNLPRTNQKRLNFVHKTLNGTCEQMSQHFEGALKEQELKTSGHLPNSKLL